MRAFVFSSLLFVLFFVGCGGGGGGGGNTSNPEMIDLELAPSRIDSGEITSVSVRVRGTSDRFVLKFSYPRGLRYEDFSSQVNYRDGSTLPLDPTEYRAETVRYLVFFLSREVFDENGDGTISFRLRGESQASGEVSLDADQNDPNVSDSGEFSAANPLFTAEKSRNIEVVG